MQQIDHEITRDRVMDIFLLSGRCSAPHLPSVVFRRVVYRHTTPGATRHTLDSATRLTGGDGHADPAKRGRKISRILAPSERAAPVRTARRKSGIPPPEHQGIRLRRSSDRPAQTARFGAAERQPDQDGRGPRRRRLVERDEPRGMGTGSTLFFLYRVLPCTTRVVRSNRWKSGAPPRYPTLS